MIATVIAHWFEILVVWGSVSFALAGLYAIVNWIGNSIEGVDRE